MATKITSADILDGTIVAGDIANTTITAAKVAADVATQAELDAVSGLRTNLTTADVTTSANTSVIVSAVYEIGSGFVTEIGSDATLEVI